MSPVGGFRLLRGGEVCGPQAIPAVRMTTQPPGLEGIQRIAGAHPRQVGGAWVLAFPPTNVEM